MALLTGGELYEPNNSDEGDWAGQNQRPVPPHLVTAGAIITSTPADCVLERVPAIPFELSCSTRHGPPAGAPQLGAHTAAFLTPSSGVGAWSARDPKATLSRPIKENQKPDQAASLPLEGLVVVELSELGLSVASLGITNR